MQLFKPNVNKMKAKQDFDGLIKALKYKKDHYVRADAAIALGELGDTRAVEPLRIALNDSYHVHLMVAGSLAMLGETAPLESAIGTKMISSYEPRDEIVFRAQPYGTRTLSALSFMGPSIVPFFIDFLKSDLIDVREETAEFLGKIGEPLAVEPLIACLNDFGADAFSVNWANSTLEKGKEHIRIALFKIGTPAFESLSKHLLDKDSNDWGAKTECMKALAKFGEDRFVELLRPFLSDKDFYNNKKHGPFYFKIAFFEILKDFDGESVFELLLIYLQHDDAGYLFVEECCEQLGKIGDAKAVEPLIIRLLEEYKGKTRIGTNANTRVHAYCDALGQIGDERAVEPLISILLIEGYDKNRVEACCKALGKIGDERAVEPLITFYDKKKNAYEYAEDALYKIGGPAVEPLISMLKDDNYIVRQRAIKTLGMIGDKRALEHLVPALNDTVQKVRTEAEKALMDNGWKKIETQKKFPSPLSGTIPDIEFISLSEWKNGAGPGESDFERALSHWNKGNLQSAAKAYEKALYLGLTQVYEAAARMNLGKIYFKQHDVVAAVNEFKKVISISPQRASTAYDSSTYLALIYQVVAMSNDMQLAIELAKKAMEHVDYVFSGKAANEIQTTVRKIYNLTQ